MCGTLDSALPRWPHLRSQIVFFFLAVVVKVEYFPLFGKLLNLPRATEVQRDAILSLWCQQTGIKHTVSSKKDWSLSACVLVNVCECIYMSVRSENAAVCMWGWGECLFLLVCVSVLCSPCVCVFQFLTNFPEAPGVNGYGGRVWRVVASLRHRHTQCYYKSLSLSSSGSPLPPPLACHL